MAPPPAPDLGPFFFVHGTPRGSPLPRKAIPAPGPFPRGPKATPFPMGAENLHWRNGGPPRSPFAPFRDLGRTGGYFVRGGPGGLETPPGPRRKKKTIGPGAGAGGGGGPPPPGRRSRLSGTMAVGPRVFPLTNPKNPPAPSGPAKNPPTCPREQRWSPRNYSPRPQKRKRPRPPAEFGVRKSPCPPQNGRIRCCVRSRAPVSGVAIAEGLGPRWPRGLGDRSPRWINFSPRPPPLPSFFFFAPFFRGGGPD